MAYKEKEENVLLAHISALEKNLARVNAVLTHKQVQYRTPVSGKFLRVINPHKDQLEKLKERVEKNAGNAVDIKEAWQDYLSVKKDIQRVFNQCLDYIGGIAVRKWELEEHICDLAENLVSQYVNLGANWLSVTIVGEDRLFDNVAQTTQIIRLRFPEWDVWSLPFTAYEFGRWIAGEAYIEGLSKFFTDEKGRMLRLITDTGDSGDETKDLAPEVGALRDAYQQGKQTAESAGRMADQYGECMRELFADAFATYFLGPAYPYARVCLRLDATKALEDGPHEPSPARRMDLMLRQLDAMGGKVTGKNDNSLYDPETNRLRKLWETTVQAVHSGYTANFHFGSPYDCCSEDLYKTLTLTYRDAGFSGEDWKAAIDLGEQFLNDKDDTFSAGKSLPVILNAAWYCRVRKADDLDRIEKQARKAMQTVSEATAGLTQSGVRPSPAPATVSGR